MARTYTLRRRAEQQAETRRRIVEAALELHGTVGPADTTFSQVAERAGVQRHTLYAHFPDERSLLMACSGLHLEKDPLPDSAPWREIGDRRERLHAGLGAVYAWFEANAGVAGLVLRDASRNEALREVSQMRFGPHFRAYHEVLGEGLEPRQRALLHLALSFFTWRTLVTESGLTNTEAAESMADAIHRA